MSLDVRTLVVVIVVAYLAIGTLQLVLWRLQRKETALLLWAVSQFSCGVGNLLIFLRGVAPDWLTIGVGNVAVTGGYLFMLAGLRRFARFPVCWPLVWAPPLGIGFLFIAAPPFADNAAPRVVVLAILTSLVCIIGLIDAWRAQRQEPLVLRRVLMAALGASLLWALVRAGFNLSLLRPADFMAPDQLQSLLLLAGLVVLLFWNLSTLLMPTERQRNQLLRAARNDALTGLLNRGGFTVLAARQRERCRRENRPASVLLLDLDHFKRVNDRHGHPTGDRLLCAFAELLGASTRPGDLISRHGGEEFCAFLPNTDAAAAMRVAERIRAAFAQLTVPGPGGLVSTTVSIGVAAVRLPDEATESALERADAALYAAKAGGRNAVHLAADPDGGDGPPPPGDIAQGMRPASG